ncbi:MAG: cupin domain-containing protein [Gammaproteobacteria bacterium]|nr:cupin domain-containing protein [Gammaproteobacteria bacterium]MBT8051074.1 cupin domain-containing protein [Gammaproteobacteria bacterium]
MKTLPISLFLAIVLVPVSAITIAGEEPEYTIANTVNTFDPAKAEPTKAGYRYWFADKQLADGKTLKLSVVEPDRGTHAPHEHAEDEFFFVLEGTAEFHLDGETAVGGPMTSFYCPTGSKHGIRNVGDTELKYLVIKNYILDETAEGK